MNDHKILDELSLKSWYQIISNYRLSKLISSTIINTQGPAGPELLPRYLGNFCTQVLSFHQLLVLQNHLAAMPKSIGSKIRCPNKLSQIGIVWTEPLPMSCIADLRLSVDWRVASMMSFTSRLSLNAKYK